MHCTVCGLSCHNACDFNTHYSCTLLQSGEYAGHLSFGWYATVRCRENAHDSGPF